MKISFEWDDKKDRENQIKHGVSFYEAQQAFLDFNRLIAEDIEHSEHESRYYCFGKFENEIMTFVLLIEVIKFVLLEQAIGVRGEKFMNKKEVKYTNESIGKIKIASDFLPSPEHLVLKEETVKVTLALTKDSVDFFKKIAKEKHTHYQTMIRVLLEQYTEHYRS